MVLKLFTTFIVVAAILASPKHRVFPGVIVPVFIEFAVCHRDTDIRISYSAKFATLLPTTTYMLLDKLKISGKKAGICWN